MTERPILFSGPMIRALMAGRKTQTRRVLNPQPEFGFIEATIGAAELMMRPAFLCGGPTHKMLRRLPRPGDRLWARETWSHTGDGVFEIRQARIAPTGRVIYAATPAPDAPHAKYWPSIHMPREFSRLTLAVSDVRVHRLADLIEADAIAEGVCTFTEGLDRGAPWGDMAPADREQMVRNTYGSAVAAYRHLWETINGADSWDRNPWVVALTFDVHHSNIDSLKARIS